MNHDTVMWPVGEGDKLENDLYINLDSSVFLSHRSKTKERRTNCCGTEAISSICIFSCALPLCNHKEKEL